MTRGSHSRIKRNAARALKQAGLPVPKNLRAGKTLQDLEPAKAEEAKQLQRKLKEITWTESMSARKMQTEIYWTKERLKQLFAPDDEEKDPNEFEEVPVDEEEDEEESSSSEDDKLAKAQLKAAQEELAKAKQELAKAKEAKEKKKEKKKAKIEQEEKQQDEEMPQAAEEPEKADGVKAEPEKAEAEPEKAVEDELPDYDPDEESWTEVEGKQKKKKKNKSKGGKTEKSDNRKSPPGPEGDKDGEAPTTKA